MNILLALCARLGLACTATQNAGHRIVTGDGLTVTVREVPSGWLADGELASLPENSDERQTFCQHLLRLALARLVMETDEKAPPSMSVRNNTVYLQMFFTELSDTQVSAQLERFFNLQETWKKILAETNTLTPKADVPPPAFFSPEMFG